MTISFLFIPYIISLLTGFFLVKLILKERMHQNILFYFSLAFGLGLGISAYVGYLNFMFLNQFSLYFQITFNLFFLGLSFLGVVLSQTNQSAAAIYTGQPLMRDGLYFLGFALLFIPLYYLASFYPYGGWDSWAVWHFKSKFIFLAGENWRSIFDPLLWRSSPHYPLLLPLINVWGWVLQERPIYHGPMLSSLIFTFISLSLLVSSCAFFKKDKLAFLFSCLLLSSPFFAKTSISQYADVVLGYYTLAGFICLFLSQHKDNDQYAFLGGIFIGFLSFTKPEGLIASLLIIALTTLHLFVLKRKFLNKDTACFLIGCAITMLPSLLFYLFVAPENVTSINGFISQSRPSTWPRLKTILMFLTIEPISLKWNGLWILLFLMLLANMKNCFNKKTWILPAFIFIYISIIVTYYYMNTYFEILWWLSVTWSRILTSLLPVIIWWIIYAMKGKTPEEGS